MVTLEASGDLGEGISCSVKTGRAIAEAGLHPASGGDGTLLCSGDMLLEALVACAAVTLRAVATSIGIQVESGRVHAEGDLDFRGTLAVDREAAVGSATSASASSSTPTPTEEQLRRPAEADRALLRRLPDPGDPALVLGQGNRHLHLSRRSLLPS